MRRVERVTRCTLSSELIENVIERASSVWRVMERPRAQGDLLDEDALGVRGAAVWGVVGKAAVAGTSSPSFRRSRSSLARRCEVSDGASEVDGPDAVKGALDIMEGAMESTDPRCVGGQRYIGLVTRQGESGASEFPLESLRSGGR